jgi:hypothetical protein
VALAGADHADTELSIRSEGIFGRSVNRRHLPDIVELGSKTLLLEREFDDLLPEAGDLLFLYTLGDILPCPRRLACVGASKGSGRPSHRDLVILDKFHVLLERLARASSIERAHGHGDLAYEAAIVAKVVTKQGLHAEESIWVRTTITSKDLELLTHRVVDLVGLAVLVDTSEVAEPGGDAKREAADGATRLDLLGDGRDDELGHLAGAAKADTGDLVLEGGVGETRVERLDVFVDIDAGDGGKEGLDLFMPQVVEVLGEERVGDDFVYVGESSERGEVSPDGALAQCYVVSRN